MSEIKHWVWMCLLLIKTEVGFGAKNVLLIIVDDLRPCIKGYGDKGAYTPNIDSLMRGAVIFYETFAQQALCAPSRNSFLTSRRPSTLRLFDFYNYWRNFTGNFTTLPQYFKENSYETKSIGKVFHPGVSSNFTDDYPWSWSTPPWHPPSEKFKNAPVCLSKDNWFSNVICPVRLPEQPGQTLPDIESLQEACTYIHSSEERSKPFFLAVGFHKPHIPMKFPWKFLDYHPLEKVSLPKLRHYPPNLPEVAWNPWIDMRRRHDISQLNLTFPFQEIEDEWVKLIKQSYYASVSYIDSLIGKLLKCLTTAKLNKNTIVALIGDHGKHFGWSLGEHGEWSKYSNFDVALRVPFMIRIPNLTYAVRDYKHSLRHKRSVHVKEVVELIDLFPTVVDIAGLQKVPSCPRNSVNISLCTDGKSLVPLILDKISGKNSVPLKQRRSYRALSQYPRPGLYPTLHPNSDEPRLSEIKIMGYSIRTDRYRYTEWIDWNPSTFEGNWSNVYDFELYDHFIDPDENLNIANRPGLEDVMKMLKIRLRNEFQHQK